MKIKELPNPVNYSQISIKRFIFKYDGIIGPS